MSNCRNIALVSLSNAKSCLVEKKYGRAFANFLLFLKLAPHRSDEVLSDFTLATREWTEQLEKTGRIEDLFKCYDQACELFPHNYAVLNNIGAQLFRLGYVEVAAAYIRRSLLIKPDYLAAHENLENICGHLVERWHFRMLNDTDRNVAYRDAIEDAVQKGYHAILDIGAGTGLLSLMAVYCGARRVSACERSHAMVEVARDVLGANGAEDRVHLIHKSSTDITVPQDLPERVQLVVTETFDAGLFGEGVATTLLHAWKHLLLNQPGMMGSVIPCSATMYVCGIECESIKLRNRMVYPMLQCLDLSMVDLVCNSGHVDQEPYTTENLARVRGGYRILTNVAELLRINFCSQQELEALCRGTSWIRELIVKQHGRLDALAVWFDLHLAENVTITTSPDHDNCWEQAIYPVLSVVRKSRDTQSGQDHCFLKKGERLQTDFHFMDDCLRLVKCEHVYDTSQHLIDKDLSEMKISDNTSTSSNLPNDTEHEKRVPMTAVVRETDDSFLPFRKRKISTNISPSDSISYPAENLVDTLDSDSLSIYSDLGSRCGIHAEGQGHSDNTSMDSCTNCAKADIAADNNTIDVLHNYHTENKGRLSLETNEDQRTSKSLNIGAENKHSNDVDESNTKYTAGKTAVGTHETIHKLKFLADHSDIGYLNDIQLNKHYCRVLDKYKHENAETPLSLLYISGGLCFLAVQARNLGYHHVTMVTNEENYDAIIQVAAANECLSHDLQLRDKASVTVQQEIQHPIMLCNIVEPCGALRQQVLEDIALMRVTCLSPGGVILPGEVKVHGMFIQSQDLENSSFVGDAHHTLGFQVADFINVFQLVNHVDIDLVSLKHSKLSEVFQLFHLDLNAVTNDDVAPRFLEQTNEVSVNVTETGAITALVYWFELDFLGDKICTLDSRCHWKQAGIMIKGDKYVISDQTLVVKVTLQNSCIGVQIQDAEFVNGSSGHIGNKV